MHLHGLIGAEGRTLQDLVLTSANFGDAYITTGWASRFVSELFARFSVLFIGYSVSDPVMRYLVDALAVSMARGEHSHKVYALVPSSPGGAEEARKSWEPKGVKAIIYETDATHSRLEKTIVEWAAIHKAGQSGRVSIVARLAGEPPSDLEQDFRSSQMVWALRDKSGQAARKFLSLAPPIEWLSLLEQSGLMNLPSSVEPGPDWLGIRFQPVHPISGSLHTWLLAHLDKPEVVERAIERNLILEWAFRVGLHHKLWYLNEPVPAPYRRFWELLGSTSVMNAGGDSSTKAFELVSRLNAGECDPLLFLEATDQLRPVAVFSKPMLRALLRGTNSPPEEVSDLAEFEVALVAGTHTPELIARLKARLADPALIPTVILSVTAQLERAMKLFAAAGMAREDVDPSIFQMQSLLESSNVELYSWTALIVLLRDALLLAKGDGDFIRAVIQLWLRLPYPVFRRLALFGMFESDAFEAAEACRLILQIPKRLFWHYSNKEFSIPLVARLWSRAAEPDAAELVNSILEGPPRDLFIEGLSSEEFESHADRTRVEFLAAMEASGRALPSTASAKLIALQSKYPKSTAPPYEEVEDAGWGTSARTSAAIDEYQLLPITAMLDDVRSRAKQANRNLDLLRGWANRYPETALNLIEAMTNSDVVDVDSWTAIVDGISFQETMPERIISMVPTLSRNIRTRTAGSLSLWMERASKKLQMTPELLAAWDALIEVASGSPTTDGAGVFMSALTSPIGQLTDVLFNCWLATSPKRASGLKPEMRARVDRLLEKPDPQGRAARVIIAAHLYSLHFNDRPWALSMLLPLFDWTKDTAAEMWQGYLFNHHWYPDLLADLKPSLLLALKRRNQLGECAKRLLHLLASVVIYSPSSLSDNELRDSLQLLDKKGLATLTFSFIQILDRAEVSERRSMWERGVLRALRLWPLDRSLRSEELSENLMMLAIEGEEFFEEVAANIDPLLEPTRASSMIFYRFGQTTLPEKHPRTVTRLLSKIADPSGERTYLDPQANRLLSRLQAAEPEVRTTPEFEKLARTGWFEV